MFAMIPTILTIISGAYPIYLMEETFKGYNKTPKSRLPNGFGLPDYHGFLQCWPISRSLLDQDHVFTEPNVTNLKKN